MQWQECAGLLFSPQAGVWLRSPSSWADCGRGTRVCLCWERSGEAARYAEPALAAGVCVSCALCVAGPAGARTEAAQAEGVRVLRSRSVAAPALPTPSAYTESLGTGARRSWPMAGLCLWVACTAVLWAFVHFFKS